MKKGMMVMVLIVLHAPLKSMDHDAVGASLNALEEGYAADQSTDGIAQAQEQLAAQALKEGKYRPGSKVRFADDGSHELIRPRRRSTKKQTQGTAMLTLPGAEELEQGIGFDGTEASGLKRLTAVFCDNLDGKRVKGFGTFNKANNKHRRGLEGILRFVREARPKQYHSLEGSIYRGRHKNKALVRVLTKIVDSIDRMNEDSTRVGEEQRDVAAAQLAEMQKQLETQEKDLKTAQEALKTQQASAAFFRKTTVVGTIGGGITTVGGILLTHYLST